nr:preprotein translocase subunit SecE [Peptoanaerobacter stomatis]
MNDTRVELRKVHWPKKTELQKYTVVVIATVAFFSVAIYAIDSGLGFVISKLVVR